MKVNRYPVVVQQGDVSNGLVTLSNWKIMLNLKTENYITMVGWSRSVKHIYYRRQNGNRNLVTMGKT